MGVKKREHSQQEYCVFCGPDGPVGGNPAMLPGQIPPPDNDIHLCCVHHNRISHTIRVPLVEDTHTPTRLWCNETPQGWGEVLLAH